MNHNLNTVSSSLCLIYIIWSLCIFFSIYFQIIHLISSSTLLEGFCLSSGAVIGETGDSVGYVMISLVAAKRFCKYINIFICTPLFKRKNEEKYRQTALWRVPPSKRIK